MKGAFQEEVPQQEQFGESETPGLETSGLETPGFHLGVIIQRPFRGQNKPL